MRGTIKRWITDRGFGFVKSDWPGEPDSFVHVTDFQAAGLDAPNVGDRVEYDTATGLDGRPRATNIRIIT